MARTIPELSIEAKLIYEEIRKLGEGDVLRDTTIAEVTGQEFSNGATGAFYTARKMAQREDGIVLSRVRKTGYQRLDDAGIVGASESRVRNLRGAARRAFKELGCVKRIDLLDAETRVKAQTHASLFSAVHGITRPNRVAKLEAKVKDAEEQLPLAKTLAAFQS